MKQDTGLTYKNLKNDIVEVVEEQIKPNKWNLTLKLKSGNRNNYYAVNRDYSIGGCELEYTFQYDTPEPFFSFDVYSHGNGHGTILLKAMLVKIQEYEIHNALKVKFVRGWLSYNDIVRWENSNVI